MNILYVLKSVASSTMVISFFNPPLLVEAFAPSICCLSTSPRLIHPRCRFSQQILFAQNSNSEERDNANDSNGCDDNISDPLMQELRYAKCENFGKDIPVNEELQRAAQHAENAFLSAMLEQTQQFRQIKHEEGSDRAVEAFMQRIQDEQNPAHDAPSRDEGDMNGRDDVKDSIANKWFVQRMQEEQNPSVDAEHDEFDDAWQ